MNRSKQRELVLKIVQEKRWHPTANDVFIEAKKFMPNISLGTVYRNLNQLSEVNEIAKITDCADESRFDGEIKDHVHFLCVKCGNLSDIETENATKMLKMANKVCDNKVMAACVLLKGECLNCVNGKK